MKVKPLITMSILAAALPFAPVASGGDANSGGKGRYQGGRFANLAAPEREKLKAAHERAMNDPAVQAARGKMRQARKEFRDAMHAAMLKEDPTIQPILDKMPKRERD